MRVICFITNVTCSGGGTGVLVWGVSCVNDRYRSGLHKWVILTTTLQTVLRLNVEEHVRERAHVHHVPQ